MHEGVQLINFILIITFIYLSYICLYGAWNFGINTTVNTLYIISGIIFGLKSLQLLIKFFGYDKKFMMLFDLLVVGALITAFVLFILQDTSGIGTDLVLIFFVMLWVLYDSWNMWNIWGSCGKKTSCSKKVKDRGKY